MTPGIPLFNQLLTSLCASPGFWALVPSGLQLGPLGMLRSGGDQEMAVPPVWGFSRCLEVSSQGARTDAWKDWPGTETRQGKRDKIGIF